MLFLYGAAGPASTSTASARSAPRRFAADGISGKSVPGSSERRERDLSPPRLQLDFKFARTSVGRRSRGSSGERPEHARSIIECNESPGCGVGACSSVDLVVSHFEFQVGIWGTPNEGVE